MNQNSIDIPTLVEKLYSENTDEVEESSHTLVEIMDKNCDTYNDIFETNIVPQLIKLMNNSEPSIIYNALQILYFLIIDDDIRDKIQGIQELNRINILPVLVKVLQMEFGVNAIYILGRMAVYGWTIREEIRNLGAIPHIVKHMMMCNDEETLDDILWSLERITFLNNNIIGEMDKLDIAPYFLQKIQDSSNQIKDKLDDLLYLLTQNPKNRLEIVKKGGIPLLVYLAFTTDPETDTEDCTEDYIETTLENFKDHIPEIAESILVKPITVYKRDIQLILKNEPLKRVVNLYHHVEQIDDRQFNLQDYQQRRRNILQPAITFVLCWKKVRDMKPLLSQENGIHREITFAEYFLAILPEKLVRQIFDDLGLILLHSYVFG